MTEKLTEEQKARYDRQIRVWGAEAQSRLQNAKVLVVGLNGLHPELVKNIVLAGVSVVLVDARTVQDADLGYNFFLKKEDVGKNVAEACLPRIQELNNLVTVTVDKKPLVELIEESYLLQFSEVIISGGKNCGMDDAKRINAMVRKATKGIPFFWSSTGGTKGIFVADHGEHFFYTKKAPSAAPSETTDLTATTGKKRKAGEDENGDNNKDEEENGEEKLVKRVSIKVPGFAFNKVVDKKWSEIETRKMKKSPALATCVLMAKIAEKNMSPDLVKELTANELKENGVDEKFLGDASVVSFLNQWPKYPSVAMCSVLGAYLAQEVLKGIGRTEVPNYNTSVFSGDGSGVVVYPINDEMKSSID